MRKAASKKKSRSRYDAVLSAFLPLLLAAAFGSPGAPGAQLYTSACASCHGVQFAGTADGPSLRGVGLASVDFYLKTGRMPAAVPWVEEAHRDERAGQGLPLGQIRALEAYLAPVVAGGPGIPAVIAGSDLQRGQQIYELNCEQCHAVGGNGGSLGESDWAPDLHEATIDEVADAVRAGPEQMPRFGERQLSPDALNDVAAYVLAMQNQEHATGLPLRSSGPVPEGAVGYVAIIALLVFVFFFWRNDTPPREREEAVRRDET
jgi:ubiquinol-cytochrome c reductase cytochrome c subunit